MWHGHERSDRPLPEDGLLAKGDGWRQKRGLGGVYAAGYRMRDGVCVPSVRGSAWITAETELWFDSSDPYRMGLPQ